MYRRRYRATLGLGMGSTLSSSFATTLSFRTSSEPRVADSVRSDAKATAAKLKSKYETCGSAQGRLDVTLIFFAGVSFIIIYLAFRIPVAHPAWSERNQLEFVFIGRNFISSITWPEIVLSKDGQPPANFPNWFSSMFTAQPRVSVTIKFICIGLLVFHPKANHQVHNFSKLIFPWNFS